MERLRIACVQLTAHDIDEAELALTEALEAVDRAAAQKADLILLPECTYPAYMIRHWAAGSRLPAAETSYRKAARAFADKAAQHGRYLAVGLAEVEGGAVYNSAFLFNDRGSLICKTRKHFMWHFDSTCFVRGEEFAVCDTPWGRLGMLICADARLPEVPRALRLKNARIILDLTNWTSSGRNPQSLTNPQVDYMLRTRALENRAWVIAADKVGIEQGTIVYCGSSCAVAPDGTVVARASSDQPEILMVDVLAEAAEEQNLAFNPAAGHIDGRIDPVADRRQDAYGPIVRPLGDLGVEVTLKTPIVPSDSTVQVAVAQFAWRPDEASQWVNGVRRYLDVLAEQRVDLAVLSEPYCSWADSQETLESQVFDEVVETCLDVSSHCPQMAILVARPESDSGTFFKSCFVVHRGRIAGKYRKTHLETGERGRFSRGEPEFPVLEMPFGRLGVLMGYEGFLPEPARVLALKGADIIAWPACMSGGHREYVARTRAAENRVFLAVANSVWPGTGESLIAGPSGAILAQAFPGREQAVSVLCNVAEARVKLVVPGTDVIMGRQPAAYGILLKGDAERDR